MLLPGVEVLLVLVVEPCLDDPPVVPERGRLAAELVGQRPGAAGGTGVGPVDVAHPGQ